MNKTQLGKATIYMTISSIFFIISGYVINIWLGRFLGPELYGIYGVTIALWSLVTIVLVAGVPQAITKLISTNQSETDNILKSSIILQIISAVVFTLIYYLLADFIASLLNDSKLSEYIRLSSLIIPTYTLFSLFNNYYNGQQKFGIQASMNLIYSIIKTVLSVVLGYFLLLKGVMIALILSPILPLILFMKIPKMRLKSYPYKKILMLSITFVGFSIFSTAQTSLDLFFIKTILQSDQLAGFYTASQNISRIPFYIINSLSFVIFPVIAFNITNNNNEHNKQVISNAIRYACLILIPLAFIISATSNQLIDLLYTNIYAEASGSLSILIIGTIFYNLLFIFSYILNGAGKTLTSIYICILGNIVTIILCIILIPVYSLVGAAISTVIGCLIAMILAAIFVYRQFNILVSIKSLMKIVSSSLLVYIIAKYIVISAIYIPILYILLGIIYIVCLITLKEITKKDYKLVVSIVPKKLVNK